MTLCYMGVLFSVQQGGGEVDPQHISRLAEDRHLKFCVHIDSWALTKNMQQLVIGGWGGVM